MDTDIIGYEITDKETFNANVIELDLTMLTYVGKKGFRGEIGMETVDTIGMEYTDSYHSAKKYSSDYGFKIIIVE